MNIAQKSPIKLVNKKICRCCYKRLSSNDRPISLFGETRIPKRFEFRKLIIPEYRVLALTKRHVGSGDEIEFVTSSDLKVCGDSTFHKIPNSLRIQKFLLWRADSKSCVFACRIRLIRVDRRRVRKESWGFEICGYV